MFDFIKYRKIFYVISAVVLGVAILSLALWRLNFGIDFTGGSLMTVAFSETTPVDDAALGVAQESVEGIQVAPIGVESEDIAKITANAVPADEEATTDDAEAAEFIADGMATGDAQAADSVALIAEEQNETTPLVELRIPTTEEVRKALAGMDLGDVSAQKSGEAMVIIRMKNIGEEMHQEVFAKIQTLNAAVVELSFEEVGPAIGAELKKSAIWALFISLAAILLFISFSFRKVSRKIKSYKYGVAAIIALFHDVVITLGVFAVLGKFWGIQVSLPFVAAFLTVLGYSVNDTIVVFDRIRENLLRGGYHNVRDVCNQSLNQTVARSLSTSLVTLVALLAIYFFGGISIKYFALVLIVGIAAGTYSSIFIATPLLYDWEMAKRRDASR